MAGFEFTIPKAVAWLEWQPEGADTGDVAAALDMSYTHVGGALGKAVECGLIGWVHAPEGMAHNRRLYFALRHVPQLNGEASRRPPSNLPGNGVRAGVEGVISQWPKRKPARTAQASGEPVVIVGPSCKDTRYTVHEPTPHFRALGPGRYDPDAREWPSKMLESI